MLKGCIIIFLYECRRVLKVDGEFSVCVPNFRFWVDAYKQAEAQLKQMLVGADAKKEAGVVMKIGDFVSQQASAGNTDVRLVSLKSTGKSSVHTFKNLANKLSSNDINLDAKLQIGTSNEDGSPRPNLFIYDKNNNEVALKIRYSVANSGSTKEKVWNPIEMGTLLQKLTTIKTKD